MTLFESKETAMSGEENKTPVTLSAPDYSRLSESYQQLLEASGFVIIRVDAKGVISYASPSLTRLIGYKPQAVIGRAFTSFIQPDWKDKVWRFFRKQHGEGAEPTTTRYPMLTRNGYERWIEQTLVPLGDLGNPEQMTFQMILKDVTAHHQRISTDTNQTITATMTVPRVKPDPPEDGYITDEVQSAEPQDSLTLPSRYGYYPALVRNLPDMGIVLLDHNMTLMIVEGEDVAAYGITVDSENQLLGDTLPEARAKALIDAAKDALAGKVTTIETIIDERTFSNQVRPVYGEDGDVAAVLMIIRDITAERKRETQLLESSRRFRGLFENNSDAVFILDADAVIAAANQCATEMLGYGLDEMIGHDIDSIDIGSLQTLEGRRLKLEDVLARLRNGENLPVFETELTRKDGSKFPVEVSIAMIYHDDGQPSHIQGIVRDITNRRAINAKLQQNMERLMTLHEVDEEIAERLSLDYVLSMALDAAMRLSGAYLGFIALLNEEDNVFRIAKMLGARHSTVIDDYLKEQRGIVGRVMRSQEAEVVLYVSEDPDYIKINDKTVSQMVIPLLSRERLIGVINLEANRPDPFEGDQLDTLKLVTARIATAIDNAHLYAQSEQQLNQLRDLYAQVSNLEQIKTDMIRIASHDLRNPLSAITGFIEIMDLDLTDLGNPGDMRSHLGNMERAVRRMEKIINDILSLERIEQSAQQLEENYFNLTELVADIYHESEPQAILSALQMSLELPEGAFIVRGEPPQLREATANLINNAIKYTPAGGHVEVRLWQRGGRIVFEVADNGYGIPEEMQEKLFQPFYRAETKETADIEGTGLGLHLVKRIVERHGGKMRFESVYGEGSTFGFALPFFDV